MNKSTRSERLEYERRAEAAEKKSHAHNGSPSALEAAITSAELYMKALRLADTQQDKKRLDAKTKDLLSRAEALKGVGDSQFAQRENSKPVLYPVSTRDLTKREQIILLEGCKLNGAVFKLWKDEPPESEFQCHENNLWTDDYEFSLSETQRKHFAGWQRPRDALPLIRIQKDGRLLPNEATMIRLGCWDFVQDAAPDCSVVASFCVGISRVEKGHQKLYGTFMFPFDHNNEHAATSPNGRYVLKLYFNGCWRRVDVDDRLPASRSSRILHVIDRSHPGLVWPAIVEKAYLKVRGGYDFPGSNSATDIAVLTGWIPQQVVLHGGDTDPQALWDEVYPSFAIGKVMCTLGTGKLGNREQQLLGLGAEHDYAILDIKQAGESREMLIKNPWADGDVWKGATKFRPNPGHEDQNTALPSGSFDQEEMKPGTFWMDFDHVFQYFENLYLNWDLRMFTHRQDMHFTWNLPVVSEAGILLVDHPQFCIRAKKAGEIWVWLNRHFRTGDFSSQNQGKNGYISLYLFENHGGRVFSSENAMIKGHFVDSPNTLVKIQAESHRSYTIVAVSQDLPSGKHNFTLSAFGSSTLELNAASDPFRDPHTLTSAWTRSTAGGSADSPEYLQNPQFTLTLPVETPIALVLRTISEATVSQLNKDVHVKLLVVKSDGRRITKLRQRDTAANSGDYRRGATVIEKTLAAGNYTIICSTFDHGKISKFFLDIYTTLPTSQIIFKALPSESSGRFSTVSQPATFDRHTTRLAAAIRFDRITKILCKASRRSGSASLMCKMSLEHGQGPYRQMIASSSSEEQEFTAIASGLRIEDTDLRVDMAAAESGGLWLVLEKPTQATTESAQDEMSIEVELLSEERVLLGDWMPVES